MHAPSWENSVSFLLKTSHRKVIAHLCSTNLTTSHLLKSPTHRESVERALSHNKTLKSAAIRYRIYLLRQFFTFSSRLVIAIMQISSCIVSVHFYPSLSKPKVYGFIYGQFHRSYRDALSSASRLAYRMASQKNDLPPPPAADLSHDTLIRLLSPPEIPDLREPRAYLLVTVNRLMINLNRRYRVEAEVLHCMATMTCDLSGQDVAHASAVRQLLERVLFMLIEESMNNPETLF
jgi:hypothetical protein